MERKPLRKGFTTGTCAAAGAKAAAQALFGAMTKKAVKRPDSVDVTLPRGGALKVPLKSVELDKVSMSARASIIKDAGDDPDVTNGAEFITEVKLTRADVQRIAVSIKGGEGVGVVTRPGLKISIGKPAINPVPLAMIKRAVLESAKDAGVKASVEVTVTVPKGRELALKTMNGRLGIIGGISILGTTGIVEPMSLEAYRHSISCGVDVALASGCKEVVFSTGRSSEKAVEKKLALPEVAYVLTGDHMGYALKSSKGKNGLEKITVAGQFGKFTKLAAGHFETHCSDSSVEFAFLADAAKKHGADDKLVKKILDANTAREVYLILKAEGLDKAVKTICRMVKENSKKIIGGNIEVNTVLVGYGGEIVFIA